MSAVPNNMFQASLKAVEVLHLFLDCGFTHFKFCFGPGPFFGKLLAQHGTASWGGGGEPHLVDKVRQWQNDTHP